MSARDQFDPSAPDAFLTPGWRHLAWALRIFSIPLLTGGIILFTLVAFAQDMDAIARLILLGWAVIPGISGYLLLRASRKLTTPARGSASSVAVTVVSTLVALAWIAVTAWVLLNPTVKE